MNIKYEVVDVETGKVIGVTDEKGYDKFVEVISYLNKEKGYVAPGIYPNLLGFRNHKGLVYVGSQVGQMQR